MKDNKEILDTLGQKIIENCYDGSIDHIVSLKNKINPPIIFKEKSDFLKNLDKSQLDVLKKIIGGTVEIVLFELFTILDENENYKIIYEENGNQVDLNKISEMLKAELIIENGWIQRFSKELKNESPTI